MLRRNVLIFHLGALGDFIVTWPLALTLARLFPQSRIFYVTHGQKGALAEEVLRIESLDIEAGWHRLFADDAELPAASARALAGAHTVVSFLPDEGGRWKKNISRANPDAKVVSLSTAPPADFAGHISEFLIEQLNGWPAGQTAARQILRSVTERGISPADHPDGPIVIHPGSGAARKNWPAENFLRLIENVRAEGRQVACILGEVELEQWPAALTRRFESACCVMQPKTLLELLGHVSGASAFVGNDSGPAHLSAILGVPTVSLFGPTGHPAQWKPLGPRVHVVQAPFEQLDVSSVRKALLSVR